MKRKEYPTNEESLCKPVKSSRVQLEVDTWSVVCEYADGKSLVNLFCLSKKIQMKLIETFSLLVSNRIKDNKNTKILGLTSYRTIDPMLMLLISGTSFQEDHSLKNLGVLAKDYSSYMEDTLQVFGGLNFKVENNCCSFIDSPSIGFFDFIDMLKGSNENLFDKSKLDFMLFSLSEQIVNMGNFQLTERFKIKMELISRLYNYNVGDAYPQDHLNPIEKVEELFPLEKSNLFESVKQDIIDIFVVNEVDYGLFLLDFFANSKLSREEVVSSILDWVKPTLGYSKSPFALFTLILFTINALYYFYFSNADTKNKDKNLGYSIRNTNKNFEIYKRIMRATNYLIVILKGSSLYPQSLHFDGQLSFIEMIQEIKFAQENRTQEMEY
jgi:hypothetical protein